MRELVDRRTPSSKTFLVQDLGGGVSRLAVESVIGTLHYREKESDPWLDIDPRIGAGALSPWDWGVRAGHWKLGINNDGNTAVYKDGHRAGSRLRSIGYLDAKSSDYDLLQDLALASPTVASDTIRWDNILPGVSYWVKYGIDELKEGIELTQELRDSLPSPSVRGIASADALFTILFECHWAGSYPAYVNGNPVSLKEPQEPEGVVSFVHPDQHIVAAFRRDVCLHPESGESAPVGKRFFSAGGRDWLALTIRYDVLRSMPAGLLVIDPSVDLQVGNNADDAYAENAAGTNWTTAGVSLYIGKNWTKLYVAGFRWTGLTIAQGSKVCANSYMEMKAHGARANDDCNVKVRAEDASSPGTFSTWADFDGRSLVGTQSSWAAIPHWSDGTWYSGATDYSIQATVQALADNRIINNLVLRIDENSCTHNEAMRTLKQHDDSSANAPKVHIEYVPPAAGNVGQIAAAMIG